MSNLKIKLKSKKEIAKGTMAFILEKPEGFTFKAGQFADYTLIHPQLTDAEGDIRGFSLASAPYEQDIMFATRMRDTAFKNNMKTMRIGTELILDAPYGSFTLHLMLPIYYIDGPANMVTSLRKILTEAGIDEDNIHTEEFTGY